MRKNGQQLSLLTDAATSVLGTLVRDQSDWFRERAGTLEPVLQQRNKLYARTQRREDLTKFRKASRAVCEAKNIWFQSKAEEVEKSKFGGKL